MSERALGRHPMFDTHSTPGWQLTGPQFRFQWMPSMTGRGFLSVAAPDIPLQFDRFVLPFPVSRYLARTIFQSLNENLFITEQLDRQVNFNRTFAELVAVLDSLAKGIGKNVGDNAFSSDQPGTATSFNRALSDSLTLLSKLTKLRMPSPDSILVVPHGVTLPTDLFQELIPWERQMRGMFSVPVRLKALSEILNPNQFDLMVLEQLVGPLGNRVISTTELYSFRWLFLDLRIMGRLNRYFVGEGSA